MAYFDRFDICEAYSALLIDWNVGGDMKERRGIGMQLHRMRFRPAPAFMGYESLSENGKEIYSDLEIRLGLDMKPRMGPHPRDLEGEARSIAIAIRGERSDD